MNYFSSQFEGVPFFPDAGRFWAIVEKYKVSKFYTAPTAIRALMKFGDDFVKKWVPFLLNLSFLVIQLSIWFDGLFFQVWQEFFAGSRNCWRTH